MKKFKIFSLFMVVATSVTAADSTGKSSTSLKVNSSKQSKSSFSGGVELWSNQIVEEVGDVAGNKYYGNIDLKYDNKSTTRTSKNRTTFELKTRYNSQQKFMYSIKEAVIEWKDTDSRFALGRTNLNWSELDKEWGLGKINNRVNFDYLTPEQEGLIGSFYDKRIKNSWGFSKLSLFGSFLYVPELNPGLDIDEDKGTVTCNSPWCNAPAASVDIEGTDRSIFYNIDMPEISEVALQVSAGLRLGHEFILSNKKDAKIKLGFDGYFIHKPENNISVAAEARYVTSEQRAVVDVTPQVFYHNITGANAELKFEGLGLDIYGGYMKVEPNSSPKIGKKVFEFTGFKPRKILEEYINSGVKYKIGSSSSLQAGYIARVSEFDKKNDVLVQYPRWNQAVHLAFNSQFTRKFGALLDYKYDMLTEDRLTMLSTTYRFGRSMMASLGVNIIGTNPETESFWSKFENNDSVYTSLKYTF